MKPRGDRDLMKVSSSPGVSETAINNREEDGTGDVRKKRRFIKYSGKIYSLATIVCGWCQ